MLPLLVLLLAGCKKSTPADSSPAPTAPSPAATNPNATTISHLHWLGKKRIAAQTNAAPFMSIWNWPESARLAAQTLDKLSTAPWRWLRGETNAANMAGARLRPLLDDLVQEESYVVIRHATNRPGELALAIRLDAARAALWETNLAVVLQSLTAIQPAPVSSRPGWALKKHQAPDLIELTRVGEWTVVGAASGTNVLFASLIRRLEQDHAPSPPTAPDYWLEAVVDLAGAAKMFSATWKPPENAPRMTLRVFAEGGNVRAEGELNFPKPLPFEIEPWNIPTNLIDGSLTGFTALQGVRPWLAGLESSHHFQAGHPPNQIFLWSMGGLPSQAYFAAPLADASNQVRQLAERVMAAVNPSLAARDHGKIGWENDLTGAIWRGMPYLSPVIRAIDTTGGKFVLAGTLPDWTPTHPLPPGLRQSILGQTNLVFYDWEITGPRIEMWLYIGQSLRVVAARPQLPFDSASTAWLLAGHTNLGSCETMVAKTGSASLSYVRKSAVGFTSLELHVLADWLESPQFPRGLHTFLGSPDLMQVPPAKP